MPGHAFIVTDGLGTLNFYLIDEMDLAATVFPLFYCSDETYYHFVKPPTFLCSLSSAQKVAYLV